MFYDPLKQNFYSLAHSYMFYDPFKQDFYIIAYAYMFRNEVLLSLHGLRTVLRPV